MGDAHDKRHFVELLHRAADRVGNEAGTPDMDALADAGAMFLNESDLTDEYGMATPFGPANRMALGYGIMLGWLAREAFDAR